MQMFLQRISYTVFAILGEVGGISAIFVFVFANLIQPVTKYSIFKKYLSRLFLVRSAKDNIFES